MPNAKDVTSNTEFWKIQVVGDYGTGKSTFAATFPTPGYLFDFGSGVLSYRGKDFEYSQYPKTHMGWIQFEKDLPVVLKETKAGKYQTIVVDDTTSMSELALEQAMAIDPKRSNTGGPIWNVHYAMRKNLIEGRLRQIIDLPANIVVISHLIIERDEETGGIVAVQPLLPGQLSVIVPGYFDEVYYASTRREAQTTKFILQTIPIGFYKARSRISGRERLLPDFIPNDYNELIKLMKTPKTKENKKNG